MEALFVRVDLLLGLLSKLTFSKKLTLFFV